MTIRTSHVVFAVVLLLTAALSGGAGCVAGWLQLFEKPDVELVRGLSGSTWTDMEAKFDRRLRTRFPLGSPESEMIAELRRQGFHSNTWGRADGDYEAILEWSSLVCVESVHVVWKSDEQGRLTSIKGKYPPGGCL